MIEQAYQYKVRSLQSKVVSNDMFPCRPEVANLKSSVVRRISYKTASTIILPYEWIGTMPLPKSCRYMYGIYFDGILGGAIVYVEPSTRAFNKHHPRQVLQLNRGACSYWTPKNTASKLIATSLKDLQTEGIKCIIAYCTPEAGEVGTIYQALGWWYVGNTTSSNTYLLDGHWVSERTLADKISWAKNKDKRWQDKFAQLPVKELSPKYKYVKILVNGNDAKQIAEVYNYKQLPYPKR